MLNRQELWDGGPSGEGVHEHTVGKWRRRFVKDGLEGLADEHRTGRLRTVSNAQAAQVVEQTLNVTPKDATHWSIRTMAAQIGLPHTTIRRIWSAVDLQLHRPETFKLSTDPLLVDKVQDIIGLYMSPPNRAVVLYVDENPGSRRWIASNQPCLWCRTCLSGASIPRAD